MNRRRIRPVSVSLLAGAWIVLACSGCPKTTSAGPPELDAAPVVGVALEAREFNTLDGDTLRVPDPSGRYTVLELIRSADW
jgi:hypothetical protein